MVQPGPEGRRAGPEIEVMNRIGVNYGPALVPERTGVEGTDFDARPSSLVRELEELGPTVEISQRLAVVRERQGDPTGGAPEPGTESKEDCGAEWFSGRLRSDRREASPVGAPDGF